MKFAYLKLIGALVAVGIVGALALPCAGLAAESAVAISNFGFEEQEAGPTHAREWQQFGSGYMRDLSVAHSGSASIRVENFNDRIFSGASQRVDLQQKEIKPVFFGGWVKGENIRMANGTFMAASLYVEIHQTNGQVVHWNSIPNLGSFDWRWIGLNTGTIQKITGPIDYIVLKPTVGYASGVAYFDDLEVYEGIPESGAVTFMFDDGYRSVYGAARDILHARGFVGTVAVISGYMNTKAGYVTRGQVRKLHQDGWEIAAHSVTHPVMVDLPLEKAAGELKQSKKDLEDLGVPVYTFAFPYGSYNAALVALARESGYVSTRAYEPGTNATASFPHDIKMYGITTKTTQDEVAQLVRDAKEKKQWLVLTFHSIAKYPKSEYDATSDQLKGFAETVAQSGLPVLTYYQALQRFAVHGDQLPAAPPVEVTRLQKVQNWLHYFIRSRC